VEGELTVLPDLPEHARAGIFAAPATYRAYVRFSNGAGKRQPDTKPDLRGVAVKVVGVPGKKIIGGLEDAKTQDFLLTKTETTAFRDAGEFVAVAIAAARPFPGIFRLFGQVGFLRAIGLLRRILAAFAEPIASVATTSYYSALPIQIGAYAARYALVPHAAPDPGARPGVSPDYLGEELAGRLREGAVSYDLRLQFYVDAVRTPIEDASVAWNESDAPFLTVARLVLPKQDPGSARGRRVADFVERLAFDPWHATTDLRPLGNIMRARNPAYRLSAQERGAAPEPDGTEDLG
jgi:hypothetical protein